MDMIRFPVPGEALAVPSSPALRPPPAPSPQAQAEDETTAEVDIGGSVRAAMAASVDYQIVTRTFAEDGTGAGLRAAAHADAEVSAGARVAPEPSSPPAGIEADVEVNVTAQAVTRSELEIESGTPPDAAPPPQQGDPLILDLDGDGIETTGVAAGVRFDFDGDGHAEITSFATGGDAFVALDLNGNGRIDSARELMGDQNGDANGFEALRRHDDNGDGRIDAKDAVFSRLLLVSATAEGRLETRRFDESGVRQVNLGYRQTLRYLNVYDFVAQAGTFVHADGRIGLAADVVVAYRRA